MKHTKAQRNLKTQFAKTSAAIKSEAIDLKSTISDSYRSSKNDMNDIADMIYQNSQDATEDIKDGIHKVKADIADTKSKVADDFR